MRIRWASQKKNAPQFILVLCLKAAGVYYLRAKHRERTAHNTRRVIPDQTTNTPAARPKLTMAQKETATSCGSIHETLENKTAAGIQSERI